MHETRGAAVTDKELLQQRCRAVLEDAENHLLEKCLELGGGERPPPPPTAVATVEEARCEVRARLLGWPDGEKTRLRALLTRLGTVGAASTYEPKRVILYWRALGNIEKAIDGIIPVQLLDHIARRLAADPGLSLYELGVPGYGGDPPNAVRRRKRADETVSLVAEALDAALGPHPVSTVVSNPEAARQYRKRLRRPR